jgi:hypothetical protein
MAPPDHSCDYLVVGTGAMGMAFVDTLLVDSVRDSSPFNPFSVSPSLCALSSTFSRGTTA